MSQGKRFHLIVRYPGREVIEIELPSPWDRLSTGTAYQIQQGVQAQARYLSRETIEDSHYSHHYWVLELDHDEEPL